MLRQRIKQLEDLAIEKVRVALYGRNGHQIDREMENHSRGVVTAIANIDETGLADRFPDAGRFNTLDELLEFGAFDLVSICSAERSNQADDIVKCLLAGKHVYAEKPAATTESDLNRIVQAAQHSGTRFHEMAGVSLMQPYGTLRSIVREGTLGKIVQVYAQKSYPWHSRREQNENVDGGLILQVGVYCARFVEHVAGCRIRTINAHETKLGNPAESNMSRTAVSFLMNLEGGGVASGVANYLCPPPSAWPGWGYEIVRIWGQNGFVESVNGGKSGTLALNDNPPQALDFSKSLPDYLDMFIDEIITGQDQIPFSLEEEISPTRWVIRARDLSRSTACE